MRKIVLLIWLLASFSTAVWADKALDSLLNVLDQTIQKHETYVVQRESRIRHLNELAHQRY